LLPTSMGSTSTQPNDMESNNTIVIGSVIGLFRFIQFKSNLSSYYYTCTLKQ
jgi:hypothetical protein